jgi:hypothetical protein
MNKKKLRPSGRSFFFWCSKASGIVGIAAAIFVLVGTEIDVEYLADALDVHYLMHCLAASVDGDHVVAGVHQIPDPPTTEKSATATAATALSASPTSRARTTQRGFSRSKIYFSRRSSASLTTATSARKTAAGLHLLAQCTHAGRVAASAHGSHAVSYGAHPGGVATRRKKARRTARCVRSACGAK